MARTIVFVSQWAFYLCLGSKDGSTNASEYIVHQDVVDMTLTDQIPSEDLGRLFGTL